MQNDGWGVQIKYGKYNFLFLSFFIFGDPLCETSFCQTLK